MSRALLIVAAVPWLLAFAPQDEPAGAPRSASEARDCLSASRVLTRRPDGPRGLLFEMSDGTTWRNEVQGTCRSLERANDFDILAFNLAGSQYCRGDQFSVVDPAEIGAGGLRATQRCRLGSFVQAYGSSQLDASLLLLPIVGFLPADDPRIVGTVQAIERRLIWHGLVLRYDTGKVEDGLPAGEGAFLACSFWLADVYILMGRIEEAQALFERLLGLCNDVGLLAEEYDTVTGRQLGNFPQAFSHVALVDTALNLSRAEKPAEQRASRGPF